ncbi:MAG: DMT family transporter [Bacillota bacterium]|nr:DMT family transporter [Bacillota bacterium]
MLRFFEKQTTAELTMLMVAFVWGTTFVIVKNALADIGPFLFLGIRFILAFIVLAAFSHNNIKNLKSSTLKDGSLLGFFLFIGYVFQTVGLQYTTSSNAGFITGLNVVLVPLIYAALQRKLPGWITSLTVSMAVIGLFLLSVQQNDFHLAYGDLLMLVCAFAFALYIVFVDRISFRHNAIAITSVQILFVGILCMVIGLLTEPWPHLFTLNVIFAIVITSVFATSLAFLLQNALQKYSTPTRFAVVLTAEPVFAALTGYLFAGEILSHQGMVGAALILIAMLISIVKK